MYVYVWGVLEYARVFSNTPWMFFEYVPGVLKYLLGLLEYVSCVLKYVPDVLELFVEGVICMILGIGFVKNFNCCIMFWCCSAMPW